MYGNRTRKESYKLRKIGKFNFSLTIPPSVADYLKVTEGDELYLHCCNNDVILSTKNIMDKLKKEDITLDGWKLELNSLCPFIRYNNVFFGYSVENESYFCITPNNNYMQLANKTTCLKRIEFECNINPPNKFKELLDEYIFKLNKRDNL